MKNLLIVLFHSFLSGFRNRQSLVLENAALRQQLDVLHRQVKRPRLTGSDRLFWVALRRVWPRWEVMLTIVKPAAERGSVVALPVLGGLHHRYTRRAA